MIPAEVLARVPGCQDGQAPQRMLVLPGGEGRNLIVRIDTRAGRFVWRRRRGELDRPGAFARTELLAHRFAAAAGLAPALLAAAEDGSWLLMEYVDGAWDESQLLEEGGIERLGARLAELHALPAPTELPAADAPVMARGYLALVAREDPAAARDLEARCERVEMISAELDSLGAARVLVHGDLMAANLLGERPLLVDWEYAQGADPTWDCACLLTYYPRLEAHLPRLLASMQLAGPAVRRLALQRERFALLDALWRAAYRSMT